MRSGVPIEGQRFLLFLEGVPTIRDAYPGIVDRIAHSGWAGTRQSQQAHPSPSAEGDPGQIFGEEGRCGRMVLDLAARFRVTVRIVDVRTPESSSLLARYAVDVDGELPVLVRPDGSRLIGEESFTPKAVERFLTYQ